MDTGMVDEDPDLDNLSSGDEKANTKKESNLEQKLIKVDQEVEIKEIGPCKRT